MQIVRSLLVHNKVFTDTVTDVSDTLTASIFSVLVPCGLCISWLQINKASPLRWLTSSTKMARYLRKTEISDLNFQDTVIVDHIYTHTHLYIYIHTHTHTHTYIHTYIHICIWHLWAMLPVNRSAEPNLIVFTPWIRVLPEKLSGP
jgi:hypothetical protein